MNIVSACLAGVHCRYDCQSKKEINIVKMVEQGQAIPVCPEQLGGLPTPRDPAEKVGTKIITKNGIDVTKEYQFGAKEALKMAILVKAEKAILKSKSPMCGVGKIYDGSFSRKLIDGDGEFTKLLKLHNISVEQIQ